MTVSNSLPIPPAILVNDNNHFIRLCEQWKPSSCLGIDTEFIRTNTFYPRMGLLQLRDQHHCYLVDPLQISQWDAFIGLLNRTDVTTILHSCSEDLNLLYSMLGTVPVRLFDTQFAAAFLGHGYSVSYQALVKSLLGVELEKGETRSDWLQRPLTPAQLHYASADVFYLLEIHQMLKQQLSEKGRLDWFESDSATFADGIKDYEDQSLWSGYYKSIHGCWNLDLENMTVLQKLCVWREQEARGRNRPRNWVLKDADLLQIAEIMPNQQHQSLSGLRDIAGLSSKFCAQHGQSLIDFVNDSALKFEAVDPETVQKPISTAARKKLKRCQQLVQEIAGELAIAPELLGRKRQLVELIRGIERDNVLSWPKDLNNWRKSVLEPGIVTILAGEDTGGMLE